MSDPKSRTGVEIESQVGFKVLGRESELGPGAESCFRSRIPIWMSDPDLGVGSWFMCWVSYRGQVSSWVSGSGSGLGPGSNVKIGS